MNDHIHLFETEADFNSAYTNNYVEPWVSYTVETSGVSYNKGPEPAPSHDYVEIGGIKWATMNLGATAVTDYGKYYAWGDISGYTASQVGTDKDFSAQDYVYGPIGGSKPDYGTTKYNSQDGLTALQSSDDAVTAEWGGNWRMPTIAEWEALSNAVDAIWDSELGALVCTDKTDSTKVLILPGAGGCSDGKVFNAGSDGVYWSKSLCPDANSLAYKVSFNFEGGLSPNEDLRYCGYSIRGILDE